jgi:hypothetical protein
MLLQKQAGNEEFKMAFNNSSLSKKLYRAIPLIPVYSVIFLMIVVFSPLSWTTSKLNPIFIIGAFLLGSLCAYCTVLFLDEYFKDK